MIKYRRGGKTLCALYARENCIGFMVILGKDEREKFEAGRNEYSESVRKIYTHRAHRILYPSGGRAPRDKVYLLYSLECVYCFIVERMVFMDIGEGMKKILLAGIGAMAATADSAKDIVEDLVKKGELTVEQAKVVNEELKHKTKEKLKDHVTVNIVKDYGDLIDAVDDMSAEDLDRLMEKINLKKQADAEIREDAPEESKEDEQ